METICPLPEHWLRVADLLQHCVVNPDSKVPPPPKPLILGGWAATNDVEKRARWEETVDWAERFGGSHILDELTPEMMYHVEAPSTYQIGPMGGPVHLSWNYESRPDVSEQDAEKAIYTLKVEWVQIVGHELSQVTSPLGFTGLKKRRLIVNADFKHIPPWGSWSRLPDSKERREFTRFRAAVNKAIHPLTVDHIDFIQRV